MKFITIIISMSLILFFSCSEINKTDSIEHTSSHMDTEDGSPFSDTCLCSFNKLGEVRWNKDRCDVFISSKGWNPDYYSCSWSWGEFINNESPEDTSIIDFRIHLVDLDKIHQTIDSAFLSSKYFNDNLIATFSKTQGEKYRTCKFDPNKMGKYPKPKQWTE